jgi:hypothetical protein
VARSGLGGLVAAVLAVVLSACGAGTALGNAVLAPLSALPQTDVILETNLQSAVVAGQAQGGLQDISAISGAAEAGGLPETSGPPTAPGVVSVASATGVSVYTAFNPADRHCLGTFVLATGSVATVLGESAPGTYDFWFGPTSSSNCTAVDFTTESTVPSGWASGDPSASRWPGP